MNTLAKLTIIQAVILVIQIILYFGSERFQHVFNFGAGVPGHYPGYPVHQATRAAGFADSHSGCGGFLVNRFSARVFGCGRVNLGLARAGILNRRFIFESA